MGVMGASGVRPTRAWQSKISTAHVEHVLNKQGAMLWWRVNARFPTFARHDRKSQAHSRRSANGTPPPPTRTFPQQG